MDDPDTILGIYQEERDRLIAEIYQGDITQNLEKKKKIKESSSLCRPR
jgi:hypothetical protein